MFKKLNTKGGLKGHLSKVVAVVAAVAITFTSVGFTSFATNSDENSAAEEMSAVMENTDTEENTSEEETEDIQEQDSENSSEENEDDVIIVVSDEESDAASEESAGEIIVEDEDVPMTNTFNSYSAEDASFTDSSSDSSSSESSGSGTEANPIVTDTYSKLEVGTLSKLYDVLSEALKVSNLDGEITAATAENASDLFEVKKIVVENGEPKKDDNGYVFAGDDAAAGTYDWFVITNKAFSTTGPAILVKVTKTASDNTKTDTFYRVPVTAKKASPKITVNKKFTYNKLEQEIKKEDLDVVIEGTTLSKDAASTDYTIGAGTAGKLKATDAGKYTLTVTFGGTYAEYEAQDVEWAIDPAKYTLAFSSNKLTVPYGQTAEKLGKNIIATAKKNPGLITVKDPDGKDVALTDIPELKLLLLNTSGEVVAAEEKPLAGTYYVMADEECIGTNFTIETKSVGTITITAGKPTASVSMSTDKYSYGTKITATASSSYFTNMSWKLKRGSSETSAVAYNNKNGSGKIGSITLSDLAVNESDYYFLEVEFSDLKTDYAGQYDDTPITVTKKFQVTKVSIAKATLVSYSPTGSKVTNGTDYITITYSSTPSSTPTISKIKVGEVTLTTDDFSASTDSSNKKITLTGKGNYTDTRVIKWTVVSTANTSSKSNISVTKESGVTTTVQSASSSGIANYATSKKETGKTKLLTLNIKAINKNNMDYETSTLVEKITDEYVNAYSGASESDVVVDCIDITVHELTKDSDGNIEKDEDLSELDKIIDIGLTVGKTNAAKTIRLVREHNGSAAEMTKLTSKSSSSEGFYVDEDNGKIYIYSSKFSNYTIVYLPNKAKEAASNSSTRSLSSSDDSDVNGARAPKTGDTLPVVWVWALVLLGGVVVTSYAVYGSLTANKVKTKDTKKNERTLN